MADTQAAREEENCSTQTMDSEGQTVYCPNCKEAYSWMYGEDCMPTSLSCGHTLCFKCAKSQWCNPGLEDSTVFCVTCSAHVTVTTCKTVSSSQPETIPDSTGKVVEAQVGVDSHRSTAVVPVAAVQNTPTHLRSSTDVVQQQGSTGKQTSCVSYTMDRVASALSSPLVLDKIQSQDDAWRLLQHDEGFIRDWIVANVPDHVIFKMVGAGSADGANLDSSSFVFSNGNTVVISSPPKAEDITMTTPEPTGMTNSLTFPGQSSGVGENVTRPSFEQQFLHYLVSKATTQDKVATSTDVNAGHELPACVESAAQTGHDADIEASKALASASAVSLNRAFTMQAIKQEFQHQQSGRVGGKGDCAIPHPTKDSVVLPNAMTGMSAEGEATQMSTDLQTVPTESVSSHDAVSEVAQYDSAPDSGQCLPGLQPQTAPYTSYPPAPGISYSAPFYDHYQQAFNSRMFTNTNASIARFPSYPQRNLQDVNTDAFAGLPGAYSNYPYPYSHYYSWHDHYGPKYARLPQQFQPGGFQRYPRYIQQRGTRFGRSRNATFTSSFRNPTEYSWSSKACNTAMNPAAPPPFSAHPQIRFVQVVRPRPENENLSEVSRLTEDAASSAVEVPQDTVVKEMSTSETHRETEAEVAVMKTRDMPHGTQVEDIYVIPQVWLSNGRGTPGLDSSSQQSSCPACPCPTLSSSFPRPPSPSALALMTPGTNEVDAIPHISHLTPDKQAVVDMKNHDCASPNVVATPSFSGPETNLVGGEQAGQSSTVHDGPEAATNSLSESEERDKPDIEDCNDFTDFKPVAVVTTMPVNKSEEGEESIPDTTTTATTTTTKVMEGLGPPLLHSSTVTPVPPEAETDSITTSKNNLETPIRDVTSMTDGLHGADNVRQAPPAPVKKLQGNVEVEHNVQETVVEAVVIKFPHNREETSLPTLTSVDQSEPCDKSVQHTLESEINRCAETDTQTTVSMDKVEILEDKSSRPSAIVLPKKDTKEIPPSRKRLRRNLTSEFYESDLGSKSQSTLFANNLMERRAFGRRARWYPSKYNQYPTAFTHPQQSLYPDDYFYNYVPRPCYYNSRVDTHSAASEYRGPHAMLDVFSRPQPDKPDDYQFSMHVNEESVPRRPGTTYSQIHRSVAQDTGYQPCISQSQSTASLSQPCPDVLSHLSSGKGDYSNTPNTYTQQLTQYDYQPDTVGTYSQKTDFSRRSDELSTQGASAGGNFRRFHFWPVRRQDGGTGDGGYRSAAEAKGGTVHQTVSSRDLDSIRWLQQEVRELNREVDSAMLARLEGCLALLEKNAHQEDSVCTGRDTKDMDQLWQCMLSLGQVVVHYGWWCRPHHWDNSSERWAEMAMLAAGVFELSMDSLNKVITFYLDHVCSSLKTGNGQAQDGFCDRRMEVPAGENYRSDDLSVSLGYPYTDYQHQASYGQLQYMRSLSADQSDMYRASVNLSQPCNTAVDSSRPYRPSSIRPRSFSAGTGSDDQTCPVTADPPQYYVSRPSAFSRHYEDDMSSFIQSQIYNQDIGHWPVAFPMEGQCPVSREEDRGPSVVYHYQGSGGIAHTHQSQHGKTRQYIADSSTAASSQDRVPVWASDCKQDSYTGGGQGDQAEGPPVPSTVHPELSADISSLSESAHADQSTTVSMSGPGMNQTEMAVYYEVDGALINALTSDPHIITTTKTSCDNKEKMCAEKIVYTLSADSQITSLPKSSGSEEKVCAENIVYAVSQLAETDSQIITTTQTANSSEENMYTESIVYAVSHLADTESQIISTTQESSNSEENVCAENIVYTVAHLAESDTPTELSAGESVSYVLSTDVGEATQQPEHREAASVETDSAHLENDPHVCQHNVENTARVSQHENGTHLVQHMDENGCHVVQLIDENGAHVSQHNDEIGVQVSIHMNENGTNIIQHVDDSCDQSSEHIDKINALVVQHIGENGTHVSRHTDENGAHVTQHFDGNSASVSQYIDENGAQGSKHIQNGAHVVHHSDDSGGTVPQHADENGAHVSSMPFDVQCKASNSHVHKDPAGEHVHEDSLPVSEATETAAEMSSTKVNMAEADTIFHSDQTDAENIFHSDQMDVNLYTVTVPADHSDRGPVMCSAGEVVSDVAIMLSEAVEVEVETDGTVEVNGVKETETSEDIPLVEGGSSNQKENIASSPCSGKRKRARTPQSKNKHIRLDPCSGKQPAKGASAIKAAKWNLRSSEDQLLKY